MWRRIVGKKEEKEVGLLEELCGEGAELQDCLSSYLFLNLPGAISSKDIATLTAQGEKGGDFRPAMDKAIFEGSQNPGEKARYVPVIQNLALKTIHVPEQQMAQAEKEDIGEKEIEKELAADDRKEEREHKREEAEKEKERKGH